MDRKPVRLGGKHAIVYHILGISFWEQWMDDLSAWRHTKEGP